MAVERSLADGTMRANAAGVRDECLLLPPAATAVAAIERLVAADPDQ